MTPQLVELGVIGSGPSHTQLNLSAISISSGEHKEVDTSPTINFSSFFIFLVFFVCLFYWKVAFCLHLGKHNPSRTRFSQRQKTRHAIPEYKDNMTSLSFWKHQAPPLQCKTTWHTCHESYRSRGKLYTAYLWFFLVFFKNKTTLSSQTVWMSIVAFPCVDPPHYNSNLITGCTGDRLLYT